MLLIIGWVELARGGAESVWSYGVIFCDFFIFCDSLLISLFLMYFLSFGEVPQFLVAELGEKNNPSPSKPIVGSFPTKN